MPPVKFSRALYDFEAFLEVEKNLSPRTRKAYVYDLERFADAWIRRHGSNPTLDKITTEDIKRYLEYLRMDRDYKSTTLSRTIASIRVFFEFCVTQGLLRNSPAMHLHNPKTPKKLPIFLVESELKRLLAAPRMNAANGELPAKRRDYEPLEARDYAILVTFGLTGVRLMELVALTLGNVDFERKTIRVMGKGSKERIIPMNQIVVNALQSWLEVRPPSEDDTVFLNRFGRRLSPRGVERLVEKHVRVAGISKSKVSPHKLRHTFATLLHVNGVDILEIQALLGHSSITSTQIYTHASSTKLQSAVKKLETI